MCGGIMHICYWIINSWIYNGTGISGFTMRKNNRKPYMMRLLMWKCWSNSGYMTGRNFSPENGITVITTG